jgi:hypothetical protein
MELTLIVSGLLAAVAGLVVAGLRATRGRRPPAGPARRRRAAAWPAQPVKRTPGEWDAVRAAVPGGAHLPSAVIRARTRQVQRFLGAGGRLPRDLPDLEDAPGAAGVLLLSACDRQQATIERSPADTRRALLRLQLPVRPDPRGYRDWTWVALPLALPPTVPPGAVLVAGRVI